MLILVTVQKNALIRKKKSNCCDCNKANVTKKQVKQVDHNDALDSIIDALIIGNFLF